MRSLFGPRIVSGAVLGLWLFVASLFASEMRADPTRVEWLQQEIARHDELYFKRATPEISDADYDRLKRELRDLQDKFPDTEDTGPGIGDDRTGGFASAKHAVPMLSLNKAYTEAELRAFYARVAAALGSEVTRFTIEPKYDGLAINVTYRNGELERAVTRGNGTEGDDVTEALRRLTTMSVRLNASTAEGREVPIPELVELRGEVFMSFAEFARINEERQRAGEPSFAHPRNVAVGTLKQSIDRITDETSRTLSVVFYGVGAVVPRALTLSTQSELHARIREWGLPGVEYVSAGSLDELIDAVKTLGVQRARWSFPSDGVVVKLDSVSNQERLGNSASAPRWAIAYKFATERIATRLRAITIQVGRTGVLTPVAELEPVVLGGTTVARASLHNRAEIQRLDVRIGDMVFVEKAGEIIPTIVSVDHSRRVDSAAIFEFPKACPECGSAVEWMPSEVAVRCPNSSCVAQVRRRLEHFVARDAMDIVGLGPERIAEWVTLGWVRSPADLYRLPRERLLSRGASGSRLHAAIEQSKGRPLDRLIYALGIPRVGAVTSREIAAQWDNLESIAQATETELRERGADARIAASVCAFFCEPQNVQLVRELIALGVTGLSENAAEPVRIAAVAGKVFVFTGSLSTLTRSEATRRVRAAGGVVRETVSANTDYVVAGERAGEKLTIARTLGVRVLNERELLDLLAGK